MDINYYNMDYNKFDMYQKSHFKRYVMAKRMLKDSDVVGDMACGSGYGSLMLSENCSEVCGVDIDGKTITEINKRYEKEKKVTFHNQNLLDIEFENKFDVIISFETIEHFEESDVNKLMNSFHRSLKSTGTLIFSTPYNQVKCQASMKWHKTFYITEEKIPKLLDRYFEVEDVWYQDYITHDLNGSLNKKNFIICKVKRCNHG